MHQLLNEPIDVTVDFRGARPRPHRVIWGGRTYDIQRVNFIHAVQEGRKRIYYFSVSDNANFMKLRFDTETLRWNIAEIYHN